MNVVKLIEIYLIVVLYFYYTYIFVETPTTIFHEVVHNRVRNNIFESLQSVKMKLFTANGCNFSIAM